MLSKVASALEGFKTSLSRFSFDGEFVDSLRSYVEDDVLSDCRIAEGGGARLTHLHQLLAAAARDFEK